MKKAATEIILKRLINDRTSAAELQQLLRGCSTVETKAAAIESYCNRSLHCSLEASLEKQVIPNLMAYASWTDIAAKIDEVFGVHDSGTSFIM